MAKTLHQTEGSFLQYQIIYSITHYSGLFTSLFISNIVAKFRIDLMVLTYILSVTRPFISYNLQAYIWQRYLSSMQFNGGSSIRFLPKYTPDKLLYVKIPMTCLILRTTKTAALFQEGLLSNISSFLQFHMNPPMSDSFAKAETTGLWIYSSSLNTSLLPILFSFHFNVHYPNLQ